MRRWARGDLVEADRVGDGRTIVFALKAAAAVGIPLLLYRLTGNFHGYNPEVVAQRLVN